MPTSGVNKGHGVIQVIRVIDQGLVDINLEIFFQQRSRGRRSKR